MLHQSEPTSSLSAAGWRLQWRVPRRALAESRASAGCGTESTIATSSAAAAADSIHSTTRGRRGATSATSRRSSMPGAEQRGLQPRPAAGRRGDGQQQVAVAGGIAQRRDDASVTVHLDGEPKPAELPPERKVPWHERARAATRRRAAPRRATGDARPRAGRRNAAAPAGARAPSAASAPASARSPPSRGRIRSVTMTGTPSTTRGRQRAVATGRRTNRPSHPPCTRQRPTPVRRAVPISQIRSRARPKYVLQSSQAYSHAMECRRRDV